MVPQKQNLLLREYGRIRFAGRKRCHAAPSPCMALLGRIRGIMRFWFVCVFLPVWLYQQSYPPQPAALRQRGVVVVFPEPRFVAVTVCRL